MNPFQAQYYQRLREWKQLRDSIPTLDLERAIVLTDRWWQQAPLINRHLHPLDTENWPDPWTLLSENLYCYLTRAVGICYTLLMNDIECEIIIATDNQAYEIPLVTVDSAKYIANYWPDTVLSNKLSDFTVQRNISIAVLKTKIK